VSGPTSSGAWQTFGTDFTEADKLFIRQLEEKLAEHPGLEAALRVNPPETARLSFEVIAQDKVQDMIDSNFKLYKEIEDHADFKKLLFDWLFDRYRRRLGDDHDQSS
jgi:type I restriction enzyme, R subunit